MTRKVGNLLYRRYAVIPYEWPVSVIRRAYRRAEAMLGRPLQPREREFCVWVQTYVARGMIPGPSTLNRAMGLKGAGKSNVLSGNYSKLRRAFFEEAGLVEPSPYHPDYRPRWSWPEGAPHLGY